MARGFFDRCVFHHLPVPPPYRAGAESAHRKRRGGEQMTGPQPKESKFSILTLPGKQKEVTRRLGALGGPYTQRGATANFRVSFDNSLGTNGATLAAAILATCERDYATSQHYFSGITPTGLPFDIFIDPGSSGASHAGCAGTELHCGAPHIFGRGYA